MRVNSVASGCQCFLVLLDLLFQLFELLFEVADGLKTSTTIAACVLAKPFQFFFEFFVFLEEFLGFFINYKDQCGRVLRSLVFSKSDEI